MTDLVRSTRATCGSEVASKYCLACGEKRPDKDDLTFRHLIAHAIETVSNTDGVVRQRSRPRHPSRSVVLRRDRDAKVAWVALVLAIVTLVVGISLALRLFWPTERCRFARFS